MHMPSQDVCRSVTRWYCVETAKHIYIFSLSDCHAILGFPAHQTAWRYSDGDPPNVGIERRGREKSAVRPISRYISKMIQDRATVTMEDE